jgi:peroxiredoxin
MFYISFPRTWVAVLAMVLAGGLGAVELDSSDEKPQLDNKADAVLHRTADFYHGLQQFSFDLSFSTVVQAPGMKREMWVKYDAQVLQPNKISLCVKDGLGASIISDGKTMTTFLDALRKFTQREAPADFDSLFALDDAMLVSTGVGRLLFIDRLLKRDSYAGLIEGLSAAKYIGLDPIEGGGKAHHLLMQQPGMAMDVWILEGDKPFIHKASVDMSQPLAEAMPQVKDTRMQMLAKFDHWNAAPELKPDTFTFTPPLDAKKVASLFDSEDDNKQLVGKPAPDVQLELMNGEKMDLSKHRGKQIVILEFWASWCAPCVQGMPLISDVAKKYKNKDVVFYAVNQSEEPEVVQAFLAKKKLDVTVSLDAGGKVASAFGVTGIPLTVVIGKDGKVQAVHTGLAKDLVRRLTEELETLVAGKQLVSFRF